MDSLQTVACASLVRQVFRKISRRSADARYGTDGLDSKSSKVAHGYASLGGNYNMKGSGAHVPFERYGQATVSFSYQVEDLKELLEETRVSPADLFDSCWVWLMPSGAEERVLVAKFECAQFAT